MLRFRGPIIKYIRYEGEEGSVEIHMLPLKLLFLPNWKRGGDRDYFMMIITGPFIKSTFAQFSPILTPLPLVRFPKEKKLRMFASGLPLSLSHSLIPLRGLVSGVKSISIGGGVKYLKKYAAPHHQPPTNTRKYIRDGTN